MIKEKYKNKARASFKTKKALFLYSNAINKTEPKLKSEFHQFKIESELVQSYSAEYWQQKDDFLLENGLTVKDVYSKIVKLETKKESYFKELEAEYTNSFEKVFSFDQFKQLLFQEEAKCEYCGVTMQQIEKLADKKKIFKKSLRGWTLEIDRINSNYEYKPENCVLSCYWCNNAKTDEFTKDEFMKIGKVIREIWNERLK